MGTIKELNLTPQSYMLLISNGIKNISTLITYTKEELEKLNIKYNKYSTKELKEKMVEEIITKLGLKGLSLNSKSEIKPLPTEIRIKDLNLSNSLSRRLVNHGIVTLGNLSLLTKRNISNMYRIGNKSLKEITDALEKQKDINLGTEYITMVSIGLKEEDISYYLKQKKILDEEENEYIKIKTIKDNETKENNLRKKYIFNLSLEELVIPLPEFKKEIIIENPTIGDITSYSKDEIINSDEIEKELRKLKLGLHLGMGYFEKENMIVTEDDMKEVRIFLLERRIKRLEEENNKLQAANNYFYFKQKK